RLFQVPEHLDFQGQFARRVGGGAHVFPFTTGSNPRMTKRPGTKDTVTGRANANGAPRLPRTRLQPLLHQGPRPVAYVVVPLEDAPPPQGGEQALGALVVRPEFGQVSAGLGRSLLEGGEQP